jgi:hypothetical protein
MPDEKLIRVADHPNLRRNAETGVLLDVDTDAYNNYLSQRQERAASKARITHLEERINNFESDISDIKNLLTRLLEK